MAFRDDLVACVDEVRGEVLDAELGMRLYTVAIRRRTWDGGELGRGNVTQVDVEIVPKPKVSDPPPKLLATPGGKYEAGDRIVSKVSATYTAEDLTGGAFGAGEEFVWLLDGEPYRVVGVPEKRYLEWRVHLRRMRAR